MRSAATICPRSALKRRAGSIVIRAGYALLALVTFFTAGPKETRAWTITRGTKAPQAAGTIQHRFEQGFIRAETIAYDDYVSCGGESGARETPAKCGSKARTMWCRTVTSCTSVLRIRPSK